MTNNQPKLNKETFTCIYCNTVTQHRWDLLVGAAQPARAALDFRFAIHRSICIASTCQSVSLWLSPIGEKTKADDLFETSDGFMIYPAPKPFPMPLEEMPNDVKDDYLEARKIGVDSPRAAMALLRLALQKLLRHLGCPGTNINSDIGDLVRNQGLPAKVQQMMDSIRIVGNNAVHPQHADMSISYTVEEVSLCFKLFNLIVQRMIVDPREIESLYSSLPPSARQGVENRDRPANV